MSQIRAINVIIKFSYACNAIKESVTSDVTSHECIEMWEGDPYNHRKKIHE